MRNYLSTAIENDRFAEHWEQYSLHEVFQQLGAIPLREGASP